MIQLTNDNLTVTFTTLGGAMISIKDREGVEYLWQGDPTYWSGQAPVLFPICGSLREDKAIYEDGQVGFMPRHGLVRKRDFELESQTKDSVTFLIRSDEDMLEAYPYAFTLRIRYTLSGKTIRTEYQVTNQEEQKTLPYFIGGHPGFNCPLLADEDYEDYYLEFELEETCTVPRSFPETGLLDVKDRCQFLDKQQILPLSYQLFSHDAITLDQLRSRQVSLKSRKSDKGLTLTFSDFPNLIIWSTPNQSPFIALEPWSGLSTTLSESDVFTEKGQVTLVDPGQTSTKVFEIRVR